MATESRVIDAAVRFLRSNPELMEYASRAAPEAGVTVEELLRDTVARVRSGAQAVAEQQMVAGAAG